MGADQFKMLPSLPHISSSSSPAQGMSLLLLHFLAISSTLGCTKWDSCEEKEHYCYQGACLTSGEYMKVKFALGTNCTSMELPRSMSHSPQPSNLWTVPAEPSNPNAAKASR